MKVFLPKVEVRLIKSLMRSEVAPGIPASAARYRTDHGFDLTPLLGDGGMVRTSKSIREPAGAFSISFPDSPDGRTGETIYGLVEPMDLIEIRMSHNAVSELPVVMRGMVSQVQRSESISGGRPSRSVTVSGQDFGKLLQLIQIYYLNNSVVGDNILSQYAFFHKYSELSAAKIRPAKNFVSDVVNNVINPFVTTLTAVGSASLYWKQFVSSSVVLDCTIEGTTSPNVIAQMHDVSLFQMLSAVLDVGPFNEMFMEDRADGVYLVVRPIPYIPPSSGVAQRLDWVSVANVSDKDIEAISLSRTDAGVANYFWVFNQSWTLGSNLTHKQLVGVGPESDFIKFNYINCSAERFGFKKMEVTSMLGPPSYSHSDSALEPLLKTDTQKLGDWLASKRKTLCDTNKDNLLFESGSVRLSGNESIKAGTFLLINRGGVEARYYAPKVEHEFVPFQHFKTTVTLERGTGFVERALINSPMYHNEINGTGAI